MGSAVGLLKEKGSFPRALPKTAVSEEMEHVGPVIEQAVTKLRERRLLQEADLHVGQLDESFLEAPLLQFEVDRNPLVVG